MSFIQKTYALKESEIDKKWYLIDAQGKVLGRLASEIANILRGKNKPVYSPHLDSGDNVIVINADKIFLGGTKDDDKEYFRHSGYPGGERFVSIKRYKVKKPGYILERAVKGMLPKNRIGRKIFKNLRVYTGTEHPHTAQKPETVEIN
ncbi:MAG: 50S ribosomal protein L13 [Spirochaetes bacterium]|nr:50S ribosomal protein L13 [Spirochaetota bacterium]